MGKMRKWFIEAYLWVVRSTDWLLRSSDKYVKLFRVFNIGIIFTVLIQSHKINRLEKMVEQNVVLMERLDEMKAQYKDLMANMINFNRLFEDIRLPFWQKLKRGDLFVYQYVNPEFDNEYLKPIGLKRYEAMGRTDYELFPYGRAKEYQDNDLLVSQTDSVVSFNEIYFDTVNFQKKKLNTIKYRLIRRNDTLIFGMTVRSELIKE